MNNGEQFERGTLDFLLLSLISHPFDDRSQALKYFFKYNPFTALKKKLKITETLMGIFITFKYISVN